MSLTKVSNGVLTPDLNVNSIIAPTLKTTNIKDTAGNQIASTTKLSSSARYVRQVFLGVDSSTYNFSTSWASGPGFGPFTNFSAGSFAKVFIHYPCRNDSTSWGGMYCEIQYQVNSGTWYSMGSCGYDGGVMNSAAPSIGTFNNTIILDPNQSSSFSLGFRTYFRSYDGTATLNGSHNINSTSGTGSTAPNGSWTNYDQHYCHIIVEEYALMGTT